MKLFRIINGNCLPTSVIRLVDSKKQKPDTETESQIEKDTI